MFADNYILIILTEVLEMVYCRGTVCYKMHIKNELRFQQGLHNNYSKLAGKFEWNTSDFKNK